MPSLTAEEVTTHRLIESDYLEEDRCEYGPRAGMKVLTISPSPFHQPQAPRPGVNQVISAFV